MNSKISIVLPVYNACNYLDKCISSILAQSYTNLELIIINDGSTDESEDVIKKYLADSRVLYLKQDNAGVSAAVNRGIDEADGEYMTIIGNDDYIDHNMYETMISALKSADADMAVCDFNLVYEDGREAQLKYSSIQNEEINIPEDLFKYAARCFINPKSNNYSWSRIYKTDIIRNSKIKFEKLPIGEDTLFNFKLLPHMRKVVLVENGFYNYLQRNSSVVHTVGKKQNLAKAYADQFESLYNYYVDNNFTKHMALLPILAFTRMRSTFFYSRVSGMSNNEIMYNLNDGYKGSRLAEYLTGMK